MKNPSNISWRTLLKIHICRGVNRLHLQIKQSKKMYRLLYLVVKGNWVIRNVGNSLLSDMA